MSNTNILQLPVAIGVTAEDWIPIVQASVNKRAQASLVAGTATGFVPTSRRVDAGIGLSGGGALTADITLDFAPGTQLSIATAQTGSDRYVIYQSSSSLPRTVTFANSMKAIGDLSASPALNLAADKFVVLRAADGETYSATASQISIAAGNVPAGGTTGQYLAKASSTNYDTVWADSALTLNAYSIAANTTGSAASSTSLTGSAYQVLRMATTGLGLAFGSIDISQSAVVGSTILNVANGGTGRASLTNHGVLIGAGTSAITQLAAAAAGTVLTGQGASSDPSFSSTPTLGVAGTTLGTLAFAGSTSGTVTVQPQATAGTFNFNLPTTAGTSGYVLTSAGGGASPMTWTAPGSLAVALIVGSTAITSGTTTRVLYDNAGTLGEYAQVPLSVGGTNASLTASNGGIVYSDASAMAILAGTATAGQIVRSGSSAAPSWSTSTYPATSAAGTVLASGTANTITATATPTLGIAGTTLGTLALTGNTSGTVTLTPQAAAGTPTLTFPNASGTFAVSATSPITLNTTTGAIGITAAALTKTDDTNVTLTLGGSPTTALLAATSLTLGWTGQLALTRGGTAASLTASNGGIVYSTSSAMAILSGTATANQHLASGASGAPSWTTATYPATTTINQLLYSSAANTIVGLATANGGMLNASSSGVPSVTVTPTLGVQQTTQGQLILANTAAGAFPVTLQSSNSTSAAWTFTLPTSAGTNGYVLATNGSGVTSWIAVAGTGTVTSVDVSGGTTGLTTSGGPITSAGTITLAGTLVVSNGGTGRTTLTSNVVYKGAGTSAIATSSITDDGTTVTTTLPGVSPNFASGYTTTATAAGTTTLTVASTRFQFFTGTTTQTVVLPVTSTLFTGLSYTVANNSTGVVTVQSSGANNVLVMGPQSVATFVCILTSGTTAASWQVVTMYANVPQNSQSAAYTTVLSDAGKHILHPTADNNARTFTIDSNANVPYPVGTAITFVNQINTVTIAITSDTLTLAGTGSTGSRTLAANGFATALKVTSTLWFISGTGLT